MNRVLLLIDDYSELTFIQIILKKLGFDVDVMQNAHTLSDRIISFNPNLLILTENSKRYATESILNSTRLQKPDLNFILIKAKFNGAETLSKEIRRIGSPILPIALIKATSQSCNIPHAGLIEKFKKFKGQLNLSPEQEREVEQTVQDGQTVAVPKGAYADYLAQNPADVSSTFATQKVQARVKSDRKTASSMSSQSIDQSRKDFVTELFKKAKN